MFDSMSFQETWDLAFQYGSELSARLRHYQPGESEIMAHVDYGCGMFCHGGRAYWTSDGTEVPTSNYIAKELLRSGSTTGTTIRGRYE